MKKALKRYKKKRNKIRECESSWRGSEYNIRK
jgi:hypothetical protein